MQKDETASAEYENGSLSFMQRRCEKVGRMNERRKG